MMEPLHEKSCRGFSLFKVVRLLLKENQVQAALESLFFMKYPKELSRLLDVSQIFKHIAGRVCDNLQKGIRPITIKP